MVLVSNIEYSLLVSYNFLEMESAYYSAPDDKAEKMEDRKIFCQCEKGEKLQKFHTKNKWISFS